MSLILQSAGITKVAKNNLVESLVNAVRNADDVLVAWAQVKTIEKAIDEVKDLVRGDIVDAAAPFGKGQFDHRGASFETKEAGVRYDFTDCQDSTWSELNRQMIELKEKMKVREAYLKSLKGKTECIDEGSGEVWFAYPPKKTSTTTVETKLL